MVVVAGLAGVADVVAGPSHTDAGGGRGQEASPPGIELRRVELWREPVPTLRLLTARPIAPPRLTALPADDDGPPRVRIELEARVGRRVQRPLGGAGVVRQVTIARPSLREVAITVTLAAPATPRMRQDGRVVAIEFAATAPAAAGSDLAASGRDARETHRLSFVWKDRSS